MASCSPARVFRGQEVIEGMLGGSEMVGTSRGTQYPVASGLEKAKDRPWSCDCRGQSWVSPA